MTYTIAKSHSARPVTSALLLFLAAVFVGFCIFPFYIMLTTALKTSAEIAAWPPIWVFEPTFKNVQDAIFVSKVRARLDALVREPADGELSVTADSFTLPAAVPAPTAAPISGGGR